MVGAADWWIGFDPVCCNRASRTFVRSPESKNPARRASAVAEAMARRVGAARRWASKGKRQKGQAQSKSFASPSARSSWGDPCSRVNPARVGRGPSPPPPLPSDGRGVNDLGRRRNPGRRSFLAGPGLLSFILSGFSFASASRGFEMVACTRVRRGLKRFGKPNVSYSWSSSSSSPAASSMRPLRWRWLARESAA